jgi:hypothetical protein
MIALLFVLTLIYDFNQAQEPDWSKINATELNALNNSAFSNITAAQISSIPPLACLGFLPDQIGAIRNYQSV